MVPKSNGTTTGDWAVKQGSGMFWARPVAVNFFATLVVLHVMRCQPVALLYVIIPID